MATVPVLKPKELIKILEKLGFEEIRQKGSHRFFYRNNDHQATVVPIHTKDIGKGLLRKILNEINLSPEEFTKLLRK